ncbi:MAG: VWA-like domain-containing protein [Pseudomonadota bacterium]
MSVAKPARQHSARATRALTKLAEMDPAFAALSLWVDHRDSDPNTERAGGPDTRIDGDPDAPAWTDGRAIYYGPAFEALPLDCQIGVAAHQILHVALRHPARDRALRARLGPEFTPRLFNIAADALVNETLIAAGYALPRPCITLTPLQAFVLKDDTPVAQALAKWDAEALTLALAEAQQDRRTVAKGDGEAPHSAGIAEGEAREANFAPDIAPQTQSGGGDAEEAEADADWRQRLSRALEEGRLAGRGIGALGLRLADIPTSEVPWERHLRNLAARALMEEPRPDWARPSRRWTGMEAQARASGTRAPVYEPGRRRARQVPRLAVGIDCSSSIDDLRLAMFVGQVAGIARRAGAELHALVFDEAVRHVAKLPVSGVEQALKRLDLARGGGTSFDGLFAEAAALSPALLIVLTDLDAPVPAPLPGLPVIWAVPGRPAQRPGYGAVLDLSL